MESSSRVGLNGPGEWKESGDSKLLDIGILLEAILETIQLEILLLETLLLETLLEFRLNKLRLPRTHKPLIMSRV